MSKRSLKSFFFSFIILYFVTLAFAYFFAVSRINQAPSHITNSMVKPNYIANTVKKDRLLSALNLNKGRVYADFNPLRDWLVKPMASYAVDTVVSNFGISDTTIMSFLNIIGIKGITGCDTLENLSTSALAMQQSNTPGCLKSMIMDYVDSAFSGQTGYDPEVKTSLLGMTNRLNYEASKQIDTMVNTNRYANYMLKEVPFVGTQVANAQSANTPYMDWLLDAVTLGDKFFDIWVLARNLSYILIIIPAVALGFAIMFRMQLGPQTQVTLLQSLPQFVIILLLITFSYPLAGLMVQFAKPIVDIVVSMVWGIAMQSDASAGFSGTGGLILTAIVIVLAMISAASPLAPVGIAAIIIVIIFLVFLLLVWVRYVIALFTQAFKLSFLIAFGPLILLTAAFPGRFDTVKNYFLNVASGVIGIAAMSICYSLFFAILLFGASINFVAGIASFFFACGLLWKSANIHKQIAGAIGAKNLFELGGEPPKRR